MKLKRLFEPINIRGMEVKNRIVVPAMDLNYASEGFVNEGIVNFYSERAKGGVGLIVIGGCYVEPRGAGYPQMMGISDDKFIPGLRKLADAHHSYDCKIVVQLFHGGRYCKSSEIGTKAISASAVPCRYTKETPEEMSIEEIEKVQDCFAEAARIAKESGLDGVEIIGSAGYLVTQFLSPLTNKRTDRYGGDLQGRLTFVLEMIDKIRQKVGKDYPILYRLAGNDFMEGGNTLKEAKIVAQAVEEAGIDALNVTGGWHETDVPQVPMSVPRGAYAYLAKEIKKVVSIPVAASNRITDPLLAEQILRNGDADMISMGRALIADPELPQKAMNGNLDDIRFCIGCCQGCFDAVFQGVPVGCLVNARASREGQYIMGQQAKQRQKVLIAGGGPGGMEAARVAALRGHQVSLYEKSNRLGGQLNVAAIPPGRGEFNTFVSYLSNQIEKLGVKVELEKELTLNSISEEKPDVVIVATGAKPCIPPIPGIDRSDVVLATDVLTGEVEVGNKIAIIGGGATGCETALHIAKMGTINPEIAWFHEENKTIDHEDIIRLGTAGDKEITVLEMLPRMGANIDAPTRWTIIQQLRRYGVNLLASAEIKSVTSNNITFVKDGKEQTLSVDTIIVATGYKSETELLDNLKKLEGPKIYAIGDCKQPRKAQEAVHEAFELAYQIGNS